MKKYILLISLFLSILIFWFIDTPNLFIDKNTGSWTIGYNVVNNLEDVKLIENGKFLKDDLNDTIFKFIADPFIYKDTSGIYIFAEHVFKGNGDISVFYSKDTIYPKFKFNGMVLDEAFHLSYPQVFKYQNNNYMLPETQASGSVILYKSDSFPKKWYKYKRLLPFDNVKDPTLYFKNDKIFLFGCQDNRLYYWVAKSFDDKFIKEKKPILIGTESRPGGRIFDYNGKILMPIQNNSNGYGTGVTLYEILFNEDGKLKLKLYKKFMLKPHDEIFEYSHGMHHIDVQIINGKYFIVYDGNPKLDDTKKLNYKHFLKYTYLNILNFFN